MQDKRYLVHKQDADPHFRILDPMGFPARDPNEFLADLAVRGRSPYTLHSYAVGVADFLSWLSRSGIDGPDVTRNVIGRYLSDFGSSPKQAVQRKASPAKRQPRTINHRLSVLASYFDFLIRRDREANSGPWADRDNPISTEKRVGRHGMIGRDRPSRSRTCEFRRRVPRHIPSPGIDAAGAMKLIETAASLRDKCILTLLFRTGQRIGDWKANNERHGILGMTLSDIDDKRGTITVRLKGAHDDHRVPVTDDFWPIVRRYIGEERKPPADATCLWVGLRRGSGTPLTYSAFEASVRYACKKAGLFVHAHMFRHLVARTLLDVTGNLKATQDLLGHTHISTTADFYARTDEAAMVRAVAAVKLTFDREKASGQANRGLQIHYAFPYDALTLEELESAAKVSFLTPGLKP